jgi:hypothetical protein
MLLTKQTLAVVGKAATAISTDATTAGVEIDTLGYTDALIITQVHAWTAGSVTPVVNSGDTSGSLAATSSDFLVNAPTAVMAAAGIAQQGISLRERYLKVDLLSASSANLTAGVTILLYNARRSPVA